jgi:hypothetical protein
VAEGLPWRGALDDGLQARYEEIALTASCGGIGGGQLKGSIAGLVGVHGIQFGDELGPAPDFLAPDSLFTGIWHLSGVTAIQTFA